MKKNKLIKMCWFFSLAKFPDFNKKIGNFFSYKINNKSQMRDFLEKKLAKKKKE
jgi:hypothetical protein